MQTAEIVYVCKFSYSVVILTKIIYQENIIATLYTYLFIYVCIEYILLI